jgi:hypothetical protein
MDDKSSESKTDAQAKNEFRQKTFTIDISVDDLSYLLDRLVIIGWVLTTPLWLAGYYGSTLWISYGLALLTLFDVTLHFHVYKRSVTWMVLILVAWIGYVETRTWGATFQTNQQAAQETETHGWLLPAKDPTPPNGCSRILTVLPHDELVLLMGGAGVHTARNDKFTVLQVGGCSLLSMQRATEGIAFDADIFNEDGKLVAHIEKNEFNLSSGKYSYARRPDRSTLIVYDEQGQEALWVRYLNPTTVQIRGVFTCPMSQRSLRVTSDQIIGGGMIIDRACATVEPMTIAAFVFP